MKIFIEDVDTLNSILRLASVGVGDTNADLYIVHNPLLESVYLWSFSAMPVIALFRPEEIKDFEYSKSVSVKFNDLADAASTYSGPAELIILKGAVTLKQTNKVTTIGTTGEVDYPVPEFPQNKIFTIGTIENLRTPVVKISDFSSDSYEKTLNISGIGKELFVSTTDGYGRYGRSLVVGHASRDFNYNASTKQIGDALRVFPKAQYVLGMLDENDNLVLGNPMLWIRIPRLAARAVPIELVEKRMAQTTLSFSTTRKEFQDAIKSARSVVRRLGKGRERIELEITDYGVTLATCRCPIYYQELRPESQTIVDLDAKDIILGGNFIVTIHFDPATISSVLDAITDETILVNFSATSGTPVFISGSEVNKRDWFFAGSLYLQNAGR